MEQNEKEFIFREYYPKALGYLKHHLNDPYAAEELCSDVFVKVYANIEKFDSSKASVSTWIFSITRNTLIDYYRKSHMVNELTEDLPNDTNLENEVCQKETLRELAYALDKLDVKKRDVIVWHYYEGKKLNEIAEIMQISYSYVKILHSTALDELKRLMDFD